MAQEIFSDLGLGTRLRGAFEMLATDAERIYKESGHDFRVRHFPVIYSLHKLGGLAIADMQKLSGLTHSAVSQTTKQLMGKGLVEMKVGKDARSRIIFLTKKGKALVEGLEPSWEILEYVIRGIRSETQTDLLIAIEEFEGKLQEKGLYQRFNEVKARGISPTVDLIPYHVKYRADWLEINRIWVEKFFEMEEADIKGLKNPEDSILSEGGEIYFALLAGEAVGAVALKCHGEGVYELSKMGVLDQAQKMGIGQKLINQILTRFEARGGQKLFLETNSILKPAINLYEKSGFKHVSPRPVTPYSRADVYMEYQPD